MSRFRTEIIGEAVLYCGEAVEILEAVGDLQVRAMICDPPYCSGGFTEAGKRGAKGQGLRSETLRETGWFGGDSMTTMGLAWLLRTTATWFRRHAVGTDATASIFCDWRMVSALAPAIESAGLRLQSMPIWDKGAPGLGTGFRAQYECILHFSIDTPRYYSFAFGNILRASRMPSEREHPTEKPLSIMADLITVQSGAGDLILDPFMGSGSTGCAAIGMGRRFVGIEANADHFATACRRIEQAHKQPRLFDEPPPKVEQGALSL